MLLMVHSIPKYMDITHSVLETLFMFMQIDDQPVTNPWILSREVVTANVQAAFRTAVSKGVVTSLSILMDCPTLDPKFKGYLRKFFPNELAKKPVTAPFQQIPPPINIPPNRSPSPTLPASPTAAVPFSVPAKKPAEGLWNRIKHLP